MKLNLKSAPKNKKDQDHEKFLDSDTEIDVEELKSIFQGKLDNLERKVELIFQLKEEFLKEELTPHRKVIEIVGSKMRAKETENQLSGVGFSSTKRSSVMCRVKGKFTRTVRVIF